MHARLKVLRGYSRAEAAVYERWLAGAVSSAVSPVIAEIAGSTSEGAQIADVGCGGGRVLEALQVVAPRVRPVGIDLSAFELAAARRRLYGNVALVQGSAGDLPFRSNTFDVTLSVCSIKHWPDQSRGLSECVRITKSGGTLVIVELDGEARLAEWRRFVAGTDVPKVLTRAYARASHRLIVRWSATARALTSLFAGLQVSEVRVEPVPNEPMIAVIAKVI